MGFDTPLPMTGLRMAQFGRLLPTAGGRGQLGKLEESARRAEGRQAGGGQRADGIQLPRGLARDFADGQSMDASDVDVCTQKTLNLTDRTRWRGLGIGTRASGAPPRRKSRIDLCRLSVPFRVRKGTRGWRTLDNAPPPPKDGAPVVIVVASHGVAHPEIAGRNDRKRRPALQGRPHDLLGGAGAIPLFAVRFG
jgi:hypothetical protein